jgi:WD40 repeat protein
MKGGKIIVGCRDGTITEISGGSKNVLMESHSDGEVWGLDISKENPNLFVSSGDDNKVKVWDAVQHKCIATAELETKPGAKRKAGSGASTLANTAPN